MPKAARLLKRLRQSKSAKGKVHFVSFDEGTRAQLEQQIKDAKLEHVPISDLKPNPRNAKTHPDHQIKLLAANFAKFGFTQSILVDENNVIVSGHARYRAALLAGLSQLPAIRFSDLTATAKRAMALADNRLPELGEWDPEALSEELEFLFDSQTELEFDPEIIGFEPFEPDDVVIEDPPRRRGDPRRSR